MKQKSIAFINYGIPPFTACYETIVGIHSETKESPKSILICYGDSQEIDKFTR